MSSTTHHGDVALPDYEDDYSQPLPLYSQEVPSSECLLQTDAPRRTGCPACEWIFTPSKHLRVNFGRRLWKISGPAYGLNSVVEGTLQLSDKKHRPETITATLEGRVKTSCPERIPSDDNSSPFMSVTVPVAVSVTDQDDKEIPFAIPFPAYLTNQGERTLCPPSFNYVDSHFMCDIFYSIRFDITWKGKRWNKTESKAIPIYYLPKTTPSTAPITTLPPASRHRENPPLFLQGSERMQSYPIPPSFRSKSRPSPQQCEKLNALKDSVYLSLPTPASFTSGQAIPFMISLFFPNEPYLANLFSQAPEVQLLKCVGFHRKSSPADVGAVVERNVLISSATIRRTSGWTEGMVVLKGDIQAGDAGGEGSWSLKDVAYTQYILRFTLKPPHSLLSHVPVFIHEAPVEICTSNWGSLEREMASRGGVTTPAVSLTNNLRPLY